MVPRRCLPKETWSDREALSVPRFVIDRGSQCSQIEEWPTLEPRQKDYSIPFGEVLRKAEQLCLFVDIDPAILSGKPRIDGTRIPLYRVLNAIEEYGSIEDAAKAFRSLTTGQVRDAVKFAAAVLESPIEYEA